MRTDKPRVSEMTFGTLNLAYPLIIVAILVAIYAVIMVSLNFIVKRSPEAGPPSICEEYRAMSKAAQSRAVELKNYCEGN